MEASGWRSFRTTVCPEQRDCQQEGHNGIFLGNFTSLSEPTQQTEHPQLSAHQLGPKSSSAEAADPAKNCHGVNPAAKGSTATRHWDHPSPSRPLLTYIHKFCGEFEGRRLKAKIPGGAGEDKPKIDVDYVSIRIQQDVAIVPAQERGNLNFKH